jgi:hypothetical protein
MRMTTQSALERRGRRQFLALLASSIATGGLSACGGGGATPVAAAPISKSAKRGIAYDRLST